MANKDRQKQKREKALKRRRRLRTAEHKRAKRDSVFLEGYDSYVKEYRDLIRAPIVEPLLGIFELDDEAFYNPSAEDRLNRVGLSGHSAINYDCEHEGHEVHDTEVKATGFLNAIQCPNGEIQPAIFLRSRVDLGDGADKSGGRGTEEVTFGIRVLLLLHELGHADDVAKSINFNHVDRKLDLVGAEVYAHRFACAQAKRRNYRLALGFWLDNIEMDLQSDTAYLRIVATRFTEDVDIAELRAFAADSWSSRKGREYYLAMERSKKRRAK